MKILNRPNMSSLKPILVFTFILLQLPFCNINVYSQNPELPEPPVVTPVIKNTPPSDAIVLFEKGTLDNFKSVKTGGPAEWKAKGKKFTIVPGTGSIITKQKFGNCQVHIEWRTPVKDVKEKKEGQKSGNSGIYFMKRYEVQLLNSFRNKTYADGQAGAISARYAPQVNASLPPGKWQTFDIIFTAPVYNRDGSVKSKGYFTVFHNGVLIQSHVEINTGISSEDIEATGELFRSPILLQDHSNEVSFRNIWVREL